MVDNTELNAASGGDTIATDDIAGVKHQRVKIQYGADGSATDVSAASPLPVDVKTSVLPTGAATSAAQLADGHNVTVDNASGASAVNVQDGGNSLTVDNGGTFATQVDNTVTVDGSAVTQPVSAASLPLPSGAATAANQLSDGHNVTVDNASGASAVNIQDGGNSLTVDNGGTFVVQEDGAALTALQKIDDPVKVDDAAFALTTDSVQMAGAIRDDILATLAAAEGDAIPLRTDSMGALWARAPNIISTNNSTTATLANGATFTGVGDDVHDDASITVMIDASHDSATDGMTFQFSTNNSNWDDVYPFTYTAANGARRFQLPVTARYFRVVYTNGGTNQTHFRCQTILHSAAVSSTVRRLFEDEDPDRSAQIIKSVLIAQKAGAGDFVPVQSTNGGNLKIALEEYDGVPTGSGVASGALRVELPTDGTGKVGLNAGTNVVGDVGISGTRTSGGTTLYKNIDVDESEDQVKGTAGQVYWIHAINLKATPLFLKFYNVAAASVTVGTTVPDLTFPVPSAGDTNGAGFTLTIPNGIEFDTAITVAATTGVADNDSGAPGANELILNLGYA